MASDVKQGGRATRASQRVFPDVDLKKTKTVAVVTGATNGIGAITALELARRGATVVLAVRDLAAGQSVAADINRTEGVKGSAVVPPTPLDLSSFDSVKKFAADIGRKYAKIDLLINNAGVAQIPFSLTKDGIETSMQVNHLSHFLLTHLLLDNLAKSPSARVVNVASSVHNKGHLVLDDINWENRTYDSWQAYRDSKVANVLFAAELARRLPASGYTNIVSYSVHPGVVSTELWRNKPCLRCCCGLLCCVKTPAKGATTTLHCALNPQLAAGETTVNGRYFADEHVAAEKGEAAASNSVELARDLWERSIELTGVDADVAEKLSGDHRATKAKGRGKRKKGSDVSGSEAAESSYHSGGGEESGTDS